MSVCDSDVAYNVETVGDTWHAACCVNCVNMMLVASFARSNSLLNCIVHAFTAFMLKFYRVHCLL